MPQVVCIGGACIERKYHILSAPQPGTSNPARARRGFGGVARNVAENLARLGIRTALFSVVGNDENGVALIEHAQRAGIDASLVIRDSNYVTPEYGAVLSPTGDLLIGLADMEAVDALTLADVQRRWETVARSEWIFVDCNVNGEILAWCIAQARAGSMKLAIDAVSEPKVCRLPEDLSGVDLLILNEKEAAVYVYEDLETFRLRAPLDRARRVQECGAQAVILTRGAQGMAAVAADCAAELPALRAACVDETGAGDALIAAAIYGLLQGKGFIGAARIGSLCAGLTVESASSVRADLTPALLARHMHRLDECART